jgi:hypothetical protein
MEDMVVTASTMLELDAQALSFSLPDTTLPLSKRQPDYW